MSSLMLSSPASAGTTGSSGFPFSTGNQSVASGGSGGGGSKSGREGNTGARTQFHAPLEPEVVARLDEIFFKFLQKLCSDLNACDSKGDQIHQPLMAKKMQRLEASTDFRPFKFRIQAFTNAFHESLVQHGLTEDILPLRKVKVYLWKHKYISRFNEDGKKQKSKGNHVWNIEARKLPDPSTSTSTSTSALTSTSTTGDAGSSSSKAAITTGFEGSPSYHGNPLIRWEFREYTSRIAGQIIKFARVGVPYIYTPRIWDAQMSCPAAEYSSPWLPKWLKWHRGELRGTPGPADTSCSITVVAEYMREGEKCKLELTFQLTVSDPEKEGELMDLPNEEEEEERDEDEDDDDRGGESSDDDEDDDEAEYQYQDSGEATRGRGRNRKQGRERQMTPGTMNFNLTSPEQLDLDSYQQALKRIIFVLANSSSSSKSSNSNNSNLQAAIGTSSTTEVLLGSGGILILDTSITVPGFSGEIGGATILTSTQNYPLSFIATSQLPAIQTTPPVQYFIRLPLNPLTHDIQCQLSARQLCSKHVMLLDRILRRLCDASPGAFMVGYSDGLSGIDAGKEVVYSGENGSHRCQQQQSITAAGVTGNMDIDNHTGGLVGHVKHPSNTTTGDITKSANAVKNTKNEPGLTADSATVSIQNQSHKLSAPNQVDQTDCLAIEDSEGILNYDFGLQEDIDQLADVHHMVEIDELHDMLWVN
ncbi:hypothetical protein BGZ80_002475 [Entomortierella chlamydospora]|uniref:Uncharacterized protein n=1 Tax=Entomortierella chlamydospora TaxID=101097 RepID=A0A9P6SX41_9FUNG|nr:hypothetical protein BGZ80_002475 [Entomortierella chlamydospora]